jgi:SAM-dependent methyltransferase
MKIVAVGDPTHEVTELEEDAIEQDESERAGEAIAAKRARPHAPVEELEELTDEDVAPIPAAAAKPAPARAEPPREVPISAAQAEALVAAAPPLPTGTAAPSTGAATAAGAPATNVATTATPASAPATTAPSLPTTAATPTSGAAASGAAVSIPSAPREGDAPKPPPPPVRNKPKTPSLPRPAPQTKRRQRPPWWEELFNEDFERANLRLSNEQIRREVDFIEESLGVASGGVVLDLACGNGSHAVELASRGYGVVGYDLSLHQLALASDFANERGQKLNFLQGDMREMAFEEMFDGIFSWNTSFGYFEEEKNAHVAERVFQALRPGGMFLIDVINRDYAAATSPSSLWFEGDSCVCMDDMSVDFITSRLRVKRSVILDDGRTRETVYSIRLYSLHELGKLLHDVGFRVTEASGHPATPGVFFGQHSPRIIMLAQKP